MEFKLVPIIIVLLVIGEVNLEVIEESNLQETQKKDYSNVDKDDQDNADDSADVENENEEGLILFNPTDEWQEIKQYHKLPPGLHIRLNLQTGVKEAKLLSNENEESSEIAIPYFEAKTESIEEDDSVKSNENSIDENLKERIRSALKGIKNEDPEKDPNSRKYKKKKFRTYDALKAEFEHLDMKLQSEAEILSQLISDFGESDDDYKLNILEDLDFLTHQIDNAVDFVNMGGIQKIINPSLNSTNDEIRKGVMKLIGSASQSNPKVQIAAYEGGLIDHLLRVVAKETDNSVSSKAVFAISCLVRGFPYGQQKFIEWGGLDTLRGVFLHHDFQSLTLQLKVVKFIQALLEERVTAEGERARQFSKLDLSKSLVDGEWCSAFTHLLSGVSFDKRGKREDLGAAISKGFPLRPEHDMVDTLISTMSLVAEPCQDSFFGVVPLLQSLKETYSDLAYKERQQGEDGYEFFQELADQIRGLLAKLSLKEEL